MFNYANIRHNTSSSAGVDWLSDSDELPDWERAFVGSIGGACLLWTSIHATAHNIALLIHNYDVKDHPEREVTTTTLATALYNM